MGTIFCVRFLRFLEKALAKVLATGTGTPVILKEGMNSYSPRWSPNGTGLLAITAEGLSLISPDGKRNEFLTREVWGNQAWSQDGRTIYGLKFEGQQVWLCSVDLSTRLVKRLNELARGSNAQYYGFSLSPDGTSVITSEIRFYHSIWLLEDFAQPTGFFARLRQKLN